MATALLLELQVGAVSGHCGERVFHAFSGLPQSGSTATTTLEGDPVPVGVIREHQVSRRRSFEGGSSGG